MIFVSLYIEYLKSILEWYSESHLGMNTKTNEMIISFGSEPDMNKLSMNSIQIERESVSKLLVLIGEDLKWGPTVKYT
jgi:hypothetical protein